MTIKTGPHSLTPTADALRLAKYATLALLVDDFGPAEQMRADNLGITIIGRSYSPFDARSQFARGLSPIDSATEFINSPRQKPVYELNPQIKIWTGHNEFNPTTPAEMEWYSDFEVERLRQLAVMGLRGCVGNYSVGTPDLALWPQFYPAIRECILQDGILGLHEYGALWMWWMTGKYQINPNEDEGDEGWTTLRYRKVLRSFTPELQEVQIAITECGLDLVSPPPISGQNGDWRNCARYWPMYDGSRDPIDYWRNGGRDPELYYAEQLIWYEKELRKDPQVIGATVFTVGYNNPAWGPFDIYRTRVVDRLEEYGRIAPPIDNPPDEPPTNGDGENGDDTMLPINLLINGSFEGDTYKFQGITEINVPLGFDFWFQTDKDLRLERQDQAFDPPEVVIVGPGNLSPEDVARFVRHGVAALKLFKGWGVIWWRLSQTVNGLVPGRRYRFSAPLFPDLISGYNPDGSKIWAPDPLSGEVRLFVAGATDADTDWLNGDVFPFGQYTVFTLDFTASESTVVINVECRGRWGLHNNGWFADDFSLIALDGETPPPPETGSIVADLDIAAAAIARIKAKLQPAQTMAQDLAELLGGVANNS